MTYFIYGVLEGMQTVAALKLYRSDNSQVVPSGLGITLLEPKKRARQVHQGQGVIGDCYTEYTAMSLDRDPLINATKSRICDH